MRIARACLQPQNTSTRSNFKSDCKLELAIVYACVATLFPDIENPIRLASQLASSQPFLEDGNSGADIATIEEGGPASSVRAVTS
jgi:hypothetical protein